MSTATAVLLMSLAADPVVLFDGQSLDGWYGTAGVWRVEDGAIVAGSDTEPAPRNEFLTTNSNYADFELTAKFRLSDDATNPNAGIQFRTMRIADDFEVIGYQADIGPGYFGALYDESRRRRMLARPSEETLTQALEGVGPGGWHHYRVRAVGPHIELWLNGVKTVDFAEPDDGVAVSGKIALQIHGGMTGTVRYKDLRVVPYDRAD